MTNEEKLDLSRKACECLNSAYKTDPAAFYALMCNRVPCTKETIDHPFIVVDMIPVEPGKGLATVGWLGITVGMMVAMGLPRIAGQYSDEAVDEDGRHQFIGFVVLESDLEKMPVDSTAKL